MCGHWGIKEALLSLDPENLFVNCRPSLKKEYKEK